ncbi:4-amino-4-deoxychorismate lyase [Paenibacillus sambharensis]|uniref:4-amino-4-deoxychorismate lyase n=1 Tax=Paenibacillus sambharensis TaxID=1803190 RepID=A0A2W1LIK3_9BACL|nr:aminodeoxychorismate lyase [Paenibacillus sambharensis]PZD94892.1 4-amino-4-deoxychorismate lyase [Paenibacillus sambharensis]
MKVMYNGSVVDAHEAVISIYDHGFLYGMGLFETFRTYGGRPYLLDMHMKRLQNGCRALFIDCRLTAETVREWIAELLQANELDDAYIRLTVTAGNGELGLPSADYDDPNVLVIVKPLPVLPESAYVEGRELRLLNTRRNTPETDIRLKSLHYMNNIVAKRELAALKAAPGAEGLMLTREGLLAEGIVSNLFFLRGGVVCTPRTDTGILPGITREKVLELAASLRYRTEEGLYRWDDLLEAEEVWVTNSIQEVMPVTRLVDQQGTRAVVGQGYAGDAARRLIAAYRQSING